MPDADLRSRIVSGAADAFRDGDFHAVGPEEVARSAGVTVDELHRVFPSWELLVVAVVDRWAGVGREALRGVAEQEGAVAYLRARLDRGQQHPALVRLRVALLSATSTPGHPASGWFRQQYTMLFEDVTLALVRDVVAGREPRGAAPRHAAEQLVALFEGLQLQAMLRDDADLLDGWDRAVARMRAGWSAAAAAV
ncbi:TetR/AcrR family transcriptional regulator [Curtobacterium sp. MCSS17_007]|uniref:TetR/AcrR family transcriptional regulator n=1 Tax=Curtobacterium sp. MCSS17_007 TaxID=2175646 RepID=UPI0015E8A24E|nr:TetR/AcrR family transcriptional regulator [Curtobacterium sp. MCSS17_007]WIE75730.1 TetR/AcrR family transcriptional regulator [Curtobacterium sp. MCSS17_007]